MSAEKMIGGKNYKQQIILIEKVHENADIVGNSDTLKENAAIGVQAVLPLDHTLGILQEVEA